ncbi:MAG: SYNERG-CTERM sorting domain-containing protein, partial [Synergistaceae bacterium]|nr:SYNERG-CTERM sorting domain-containing protein [Synergistaceae bacterium]
TPGPGPTPTPTPTPTPDPNPQPGPTGSPGATLKAVGVTTTGGMAEVLLTGTATFELGMWFGEDRKPATPQSLTVYVDGEARGEVSVTNGRFVLPSIKDDEYELWVVATLPDGTKLKSDKLYVVAGRGTLSAPDLKASPTSAREGERVTFDLGEWINKRVAVDPSEVKWILDGVDVTDLVTGGKLTVEAVDGGGGTMTLIVTAALPNGLTGRATVRVTVTPAPDEGDEEETPGTSGGGGCDAGLGVLALLALAATRRRR